MPFKLRISILLLAILMLASAVGAQDDVVDDSDDIVTDNSDDIVTDNSDDVVTDNSDAVVVNDSDDDADDDTDDNSVQTNESMFSVMLANNDTLGAYLVNETGFTLYYFLNDMPGNGTSTCYGGCLEAWPAFYMDTEDMDDMDLPEGLNASDFTEANRTDGIEQTAYKGWPLYFYYEDEEPGDVYGQGVNDVWFVVVPDEFTPINA